MRPCPSDDDCAGYRGDMLLVIAVVLLVIAIAGGAIVHPILFALALVALFMFFSGRRGTAV
jgi:hypothetical protein